MVSIKWFIIIASINFGMAAAGGQFVVLHFPPALHFGRGGTPIEGNVLKSLYLASLGFDFNESSDWDEIRFINPFRLPEAAVAVHVEGVSFLGDFDDDARIYPLESYEATTSEQVMLAMAQQEYEPRGKLVNMMLAGDRGIRSYSYIFGNHTKTLPADLKYSDKHYLRFESELQTLKAVTASVNNGVIQPDGSSDFYSFKFSSLRNLCINHGLESKIMLDAKNLLNQQIQELNKAFVASYNGDVMFTAVITDSVTALRTRRDCGANACAKVCVDKRNCDCKENTKDDCLDDKTPPDTLRCTGDDVKIDPNKPCSCAAHASDDCSCKCAPSVNCTCPKSTTCSKQCVKDFCTKRHYPPAEPKNKPDPKPDTTTGGTDIAIINIIFFTCMTLYLSMLAVIYTIVTMDPGRDSIVYRMTSAIDRVKME